MGLPETTRSDKREETRSINVFLSLVANPDLLTNFLAGLPCHLDPNSFTVKTAPVEQHCQITVPSLGEVAIVIDRWEEFGRSLIGSATKPPVIIPCAAPSELDYSAYY